MRTVKIDNTTYHILKRNDPIPPLSGLTLILRESLLSKQYESYCEHMVNDCTINCKFAGITCYPTRELIYKTLQISDRFTTTKEYK